MIIVIYIHSRRVCYRTTVFLCGETEYRIHLNRRNFRGLLRNCPNESETLPVSAESVIFTSPRYGCRKGNGRVYPYRNKELCLYNISVPNCESGRIRVQSPVEDIKLQGRVNYRCVDYLQFYYSEGGKYVAANRTCSNELTPDGNTMSIPGNNVLAVFWTSTFNNHEGFRLMATCLRGSAYYSGSGLSLG